MHVFSLYGVLDDYKSDISRLRNKCDYFGHIYFCIVVKSKVFFLYSIGIEATVFAYFLLCCACFFLCSRSCSEIACKFVGITQYEDGERFLRVLSVHPCSFNFVHVSISLAMTGCRSRDNNEVDRRKNSARELSGLWLLQRLHGSARFFIGNKTEGPRAGVGFLGRVSNPLPSARESEGALWLPQRGSGRSPDRPNVFHCFHTQDGLS